MSTSTIETGAFTVKATVYEKIFRFCISDAALEDFPESVVLQTGLRREKASIHKDPQGMLVTRKKKLNFVFDPPTGHYKLTSAEGEVASGRVQTGSFNPPLFTVRLHPGDQVYGFGAASGQADRNNQNFRLINLDTMFYSLPGATYGSFPFFMIARKERFVGVFLHTTLPAQVAIDNSEDHPDGPSVRFELDHGEGSVPIDAFLFEGTPAEILERYTELTGRPFLPPAWALGFHQSRWSYKSASRVLELARRFRAEKLPVDAVHLDIHYMEDYKVFTWNPARFEDPAAMHHELNEMGVRTVAIVDPGVKIEDGYKIYEQGKQGDYFCKTHDHFNYVGKVWPGNTVFPDFSRKDVRDWWADCHLALFKEGVSGVWNDMNDPVLKIGKNYDPLEEDIIHHTGSHRSVRNLYANLEAEATATAFRKHKPRSRPFVLTRSAFSGIQKYSAVWTGDNHSSWEHLRENLYMVVNLGLTGVPLCGADVGGFAGGPGLAGVVKVFKNKELYARWMELGALMPFFRTHTVLLSHDQEPWSFGDEVFAICRKHIQRRYRLLPYIYTLAHASHRTGAPMVRPVFYHYPEVDHEATRDEFMLGPDLLAAPVLESKARTRSVYLPAGEWYEYETGKVFAGGQAHVMNVKPGYFPLFVRAGAVLPVCTTTGINAETSLRGGITLEVYPADRLAGELILDDLESTEDGRIRLALSGKRDRTGGLRLELRRTEDGFDPADVPLRVRVPTNYHTMSAGQNRVEGVTEDLSPEDRGFEMIGFPLDWRASSVDFRFKSSSWQ